GINLVSLETLSLNDAKLLKDNLHHILLQSGKDLALLCEGWSSKDQKRIVDAAHRLAPKAGQLGLNSLFSKIRELEIQAAAGKLSFDDEYFSQLETQIRNMIKELENKLSS